MNKLEKLLLGAAVISLAYLWPARPLGAQEAAPEATEVATEATWLSGIDLHGFGGWAYGRTNDNSYLVGSEEGEYRDSFFALNVAAEPTESLRIHAQIDLQVEGEETETEIDFAFAEWRFSDALRLRLGLVQQPFGLYNEVFDVGTVRPFLSLPQAIYGPVELVAESYGGLGVTGSLRGPGTWRVDYDLYGGGIDVRAIEPLAFLEEDEEEDTEGIKDMLGGRLSFTAPGDEISFGFSAFSGAKKDADDRHDGLGVHVQYLTDALWLRAEGGWFQDEIASGQGSYVEAAYFVTPKWQLAARYERMDSELDEELPARFDPLLEHRDASLGINYWFTPGFVVKASYHDVDGNRVARPEDRDELLQAFQEGTLPGETRLFAFGVNFSF